MKHLKIGDYDCYSLMDGRFRLDGGAMFGVVPKTIWNGLFPADENNRILLACSPLLVAGKGMVLLIEGGVGQAFRNDEKLLDIYAIESCGLMEDGLREAGFTAGDITHAVYTHLHWDHAGNACRMVASGDFVPRFPAARYIVQKGEWETAVSGRPSNRGSYLPETLTPLATSGHLDLIDGDYCLNEDISLRITGGHTEFHQVVMLRSAGQGLIYWGDLIPTSKHIHIPHIMAYDRFPARTYASKEQLLDETSTGGYFSAFAHDPDPGFGRIEFNGRKYFLAGKI